MRTLPCRPAPRGIRDRSALALHGMIERCPECGYDYHDLARDELAPALRADAAMLCARLADVPDADLRRRIRPEVWSPLEYACHVRDVLQVQRERVLLAQAEDEPGFVPMRRDERAVELRYNEQDPAVVNEQIVAAADALARTLEGLDAAGWERPGVYNYPTSQLRTVEWIGRHTVHELRHHTYDIGRLP
jgi:hypothetical protein